MGCVTKEAALALVGPWAPPPRSLGSLQGGRNPGYVETPQGSRLGGFLLVTTTRHGCRSASPPMTVQVRIRCGFAHNSKSSTANLLFQNPVSALADRGCSIFRD